jgi:hypothetical protein
MVKKISNNPVMDLKFDEVEKHCPTAPQEIAGTDHVAKQSIREFVVGQNRINILPMSKAPLQGSNL